MGHVLTQMGDESTSLSLGPTRDAPRIGHLNEEWRPCRGVVPFQRRIKPPTLASLNQASAQPLCNSASTIQYAEFPKDVPKMRLYRLLRHTHISS